MQIEIPFDQGLLSPRTEQQLSRSGTFVDNMKLPIHRWFRYSAGFSAIWVHNLLHEYGAKTNNLVLDPYAGSGTTLLSSDFLQIPSIGIEAHPFVARIAKTKILWETPIEKIEAKVVAILKKCNSRLNPNNDFPNLITDCYSTDALIELAKLRDAWIEINDQSNESKITWLAITAILRKSSFAGTAQWQYILPNKTKRVVGTPIQAFVDQIEIMKTDMRIFQSRCPKSLATVIEGDARNCIEVESDSVDFVITSPPYANNYDYADSTRLEMSFWGEIESWGDLHNAVRKNLIVSSSQHASLEKYSLNDLLEEEVLSPIKDEISEVCRKLENERLTHGGRKHYHTMIAAYFRDNAKVWKELRRMCKENARVCYVIGDSAPYGIYVPVERWLGELAVAYGFTRYSFEKIRDRNIKWKNRKHRVPLKEGYLWVEG
jgi:DNA modification methylase